GGGWGEGGSGREEPLTRDNGPILSGVGGGMGGTGQATSGITLDDRYLGETGPVYLSGLQALVRLPIEQSRRDRRAGLRIGTFVSGYPGSPLGGYDLALRQARE